MTNHRKQIKTAGRRLTRVRQAILAHIEATREPQTVAAIHHALAQRVDLASVYRTMELLEQLGVVTRETSSQPAAYALADRHHHHVVCRVCQRKACLPCAVSLPSPRGFTAVQHQVALTGVCAACAAR